MNGWIGVDLDGTLARYDGWKGMDHIGEPVPVMVERVKAWVAEGKTVKIFTARLSNNNSQRMDCLFPIMDWCREHLGFTLEIVSEKDFGMIELWDDRCVHVELNTGKILG